ncbi:hypothetical protein RND81_13G071800 [Saponaria officinalis]|uniref:Late embryogenesis abundant protein LEA-2 subgroup domain-containing protein n=1 Tax=Saponaria officinalis TaxID=3572 RepID=A0AAW1GWY8_SAPOF
MECVTLILVSKPSSKTFASCILATCFLTTVAVAGAITCFILFRPQNPTISTSAMKFPTFTLRNSTVNFTLQKFSAVRNPNRYEFTHHGSSVQLLSPSAGPVGFIYIPAAQIGGGRTQYISADFEVKSYSVSVAGPGPTMELETKMRLIGSVKVMKVFAHHVDTSVVCRISVQVSDGSLLGFHC